MRKIAVISLKWIKPLAFALVLVVIAMAAAGGAAAQASATIPEVTVVLDAGHGGFDGGVVSKDGDRESDLNLAITKRVKKRLEGGGVRVILTRKDEGALGVTKKEDMRKRAEIINASGADAVISIHVNKYTQSYRRGIQVFYGDSGYGGPFAVKLQGVFNTYVNLHRKMFVHSLRHRGVRLYLQRRGPQTSENAELCRRNSRMYLQGVVIRYIIL